MKRISSLDSAVPTTGKRLLIVSDGMERWHTAFNLTDLTITTATSVRETEHACQYPHDLAIVAVAAHRLTDILIALRSSSAHRHIPILVESDASRHAPYVGLLPQLRAMLCHPTEVLQLANRLLTSTDSVAARKPASHAIL